MFDFQFKHFGLFHGNSTLKIGTDSVLLGSYVPVDKAGAILDIGCGCGVIAFCIAHRIKYFETDDTTEVNITGIDIDAPSIADAVENLKHFPGHNHQRIGFQNCSIQEFAESTDHDFDLIVCNPPYFRNSLKPVNSKNLRSKHLDGNLTFEILIASAEKLLSETGKFYLILPFNESREFEELCSGKFYLCDKLTIKAKTNKEVNRVILGFSRQNKPYATSELSIRDAQDHFTASYKQLTRDFYLHF